MAIIKNYVEQQVGYCDWSEYVRACNEVLGVITIRGKLVLRFLMSEKGAKHLAEDWGVDVVHDLSRGTTTIDCQNIDFGKAGTVNGKAVETLPETIAYECQNWAEFAFNVRVLLQNLRKGENTYQLNWVLKKESHYNTLAYMLAKYFGASVNYTKTAGLAHVFVDLSQVLTGNNGNVNGNVVKRWEP